VRDGGLPVGVSVPVAQRPAWFRVALRTLDRVAAASPATALRLAGLAGSVSNRLVAYGPSAAELHSVFPSLSRQQLTRIAHRTCASDLKNRTVDRLVLAGGYEAILPLVERDAIEAVDSVRSEFGAAIVANFHLGPLISVGAAVEAAGAPALVIRTEPGHQVRPPLEAVWTSGEPDRPAHALRRALDHLRRGQLVVVALDGDFGATVGPLPCLGRGVELRRGGFALARMTGAPIVPVLCRWKDGGTAIAIERFDPLPAPPAVTAAAADIEREHANAAARWLDWQLSTAPDIASLQVLRMLLRAPRVEQPLFNQAT
jgi:lauroyl/myristoyl acyltransferase